MSAVLRCETCFFQAAADRHGEVVDVLAEGGQRRPAQHPELAGFAVWASSLAGELGPVVGRCPACEQPLLCVEGDLAARGEWTATLPQGAYVIGPSGARGPGGPMPPSEALAVVHRALTPTIAEQVFDVRLIFVLVAIGLVLLVGLVWLGAVSFLFNWFMAMGSQPNFGAPGLR